MRFLWIVILNLFFIASFGQTDSTGMVRYTYTFEFNEGLYPDFFSVRNNKPVPFERMVYPSVSEPDFFELLNNLETIGYNDEYGILKEVNRSKIWGYCRNGKPYIYWSQKFNLIPYVGSISHFVTTVSVTYSTGYDPFYGHYYYNMYPERTYRSEELRQFLLDFETGNVYSFEPRNVELLLSKTPDLQKEFSKLGKRKKNKRMFDYVRRYNELNPLYIPVNN